MKVFLFALFTVMMACSHRAIQSAITLDSSAGKRIRFLSLGDSYTIGESVPIADRWSVQLAGLLQKEKVNISDPDIIAKTGWTTEELQNAIAQSGNKQTYGLVSLLIGVNNQYRGQPLEKYRTEFQALLQTAKHFAGDQANHVLVLSTPDWGVSPFAQNRDQGKIAKEIDAFNAVAEEECKKAGIAYVDITPLTRSAAGDASQFASDGLHYSGKQMKRWAEKALPVAKTALSVQ